MPGDSSSARVGLYVDDKGATKTVQSVQGSLDKLGQSAKQSILQGVGLGAGVSAFNLLSNAVSGAVDFLQEGVQAAIDDEASVQRLTAALHANVAGWDGNMDAINRTIAASQQLGFTDDETRESLTLLSAATHDLGKAQELQATAMDLARFKGISLQAASEALVKVEAGQYRLLKSLGIELRAGATQTEALAAVQKVAGGQAETFGESTAGAMKRAQIAIEEAGESIGRAFVPAVGEAADYLNDLFYLLNQATGATEDAAQETNLFTEALNALVPGASMGIQAIHDLADAGREQEATLAASGVTTANNWIAMGRAMADSSNDTTGEIRGHWTTTRAHVVWQTSAMVKELVAALTGGQTDWQTALEGYADAIETDLLPAEEKALLATELQKWLAERNEAVRQGDQERIAISDAAIATIKQRQLELAANLPEYARRTGVNYNEALKSFIPQIGTTGSSWANALAAKTAVDLYWAGRTASQTWMRGFVSTGYSDAAGWLTGLKQMLVGRSPPPEGPLKDIDKGGFNIGKAWAEGMAKGVGTFTLPSIGLGGAAGGGLVPAMTGGTSPPIELNVYLDGEQITAAVERRRYYGTPTIATIPRG